MLKILFGGVPFRSLHSTRLCPRVYQFSGDQLWWSVRKPGLDTSKQSGGRRTILRPRVDFWEQTKYGHGGAAKLWAGLKDDHEGFKKGRSEPGQPTDRAYAIDAFDAVGKADSHEKLDRRIEEFKTFSRQYWLDRLNRGWSGNQIAGMYIPTMSPTEAQRIYGRTFDDFRCTILEIGRIGGMAPQVGRIYKARVSVAVGNGKGIYGVASAMDDMTSEAIVRARREAFNNLQAVELFENRTIVAPVYHNYYKQYIHLRPQPAGFGLRGPRMLKRILDVAGVKDVHITIQGPGRAYLAKINLLLRAMAEIESPEERANRTGYNIVRINPQHGDRPEIIARPKTNQAGIIEAHRPYPEIKKYMTQKLDIAHFNYSYSGLARKDWKRNRFHNQIHFGKNGSHMSGFMEYYQIPHSIQNIKNGKIPKEFVGMDVWEDEKQFIFKERPAEETNIITGFNPLKPNRAALADKHGFGCFNA